MEALETLRTALPDAAKDIRLNVPAVLKDGALSEPQRWGVAVDAAVVEDARAAAALMAMNNVYYRFRHMMGKPGYSEMRAGLRMNRLAQPATARADLELFSLAVSVINGCEMCVRAHEKAVTEAGLTAEHVNDAVRIAATLYAVSLSLKMD